MEQHPIPRSVTTFEFKLIGFMTLRQFLYCVMGALVGYVVFLITPFPFVNFLFGLSCFGVGAAFAFLPVNDRPLSVFVANLWQRLTSPTQYLYKKDNPPPSYLRDLYFGVDPHISMSHAQSRDKLIAYLKSQKSTPPDQNLQRKQHIASLLFTPQKTAVLSGPPHNPTSSPAQTNKQKILGTPVLTGVVMNRKKIPLPGVLVYVKDKQGTVVRILKTNAHGVFASFHPLAPNQYIVEAKDTSQNYFFDTILIDYTPNSTQQLTLYSKEVL